MERKVYLGRSRSSCAFGAELQLHASPGRPSRRLLCSGTPTKRFCILDPRGLVAMPLSRIGILAFSLIQELELIQEAGDGDQRRENGVRPEVVGGIAQARHHRASDLPPIAAVRDSQFVYFCSRTRLLRPGET